MSSVWSCSVQNGRESSRPIRFTSRKHSHLFHVMGTDEFIERRCLERGERNENCKN